MNKLSYSDLKYMVENTDKWIKDYIDNKNDIVYIEVEKQEIEFQKKFLWVNLLLIKPIIERDMPIKLNYIHKDELFTSNVQTRIHTQILKDILNYNKDEDKNTIVWELVITVNLIYNVITFYLDEYQNTIDLFSILSILEEPEIAEVTYVDPDKIDPEKINMSEIESNIKEMGNKLTNTLLDERYKDINIFYPLLKTNSISPAQLQQVIQIIGPRTDCSDITFRKPIKSSYLSGIINAAEFYCDSFMGKKSMIYNKQKLRDTRYKDRIMQILTSEMYHLHKGDCKTKVTVDYAVTKENYKHLDGKYIVENNKLKSLNEDNLENYIGKIISMRSPFGCKYTDGICEICGGLVTQFTPDNIHIGMEATTSLMGPIGQLILSNKHITSTSAIIVNLNPVIGDIFDVKNNKLHLKRNINLKDMKLVILNKQINNFSDLKYIKNRKAFNNAHFSEITTIGIMNGKDILIEPTLMSFDETKYNFTKDFLNFIIDQGHIDELEMDNNYTYIPIKDFDKNLPIMKYIIYNNSMVAFSDKINEYFKHLIKEYDNPTDLLQDITKLIYQKASINILPIEIIMRSLLITSETNYDIPVLEKSDSRCIFKTMDEIISGRYLGGKLAYEGGESWLMDPTTYTMKRRISTFDSLFIPI